MTTPVFTQDNLLFLVITPLGENQLLFKYLRGEEYLSKPFHFYIEMLSERTNLDFKKLVGQPLTVKMQFAPDHVRYFNGIVVRFTQAGTDARFTTYHAELRPWFWLLTLTKNSYIFQELSVPEIIKQVFDQLGFIDYRFSFVYSYEKREYCVQYEETAFDFVSRLMEDEGIFYFFEHTEDRHTLILADDLNVHRACPGISTVRFWTQNISATTQPEDVVTSCDRIEQVTTNHYAVEDFNFEIPAFDLERSAYQANTKSWRIYEYAAGFGKPDPAEQKARRRLETHLADAQLIEGKGHCFSFVPGYQFTLTRHPREDLNATYVLRQVAHFLSLTNYQNSFQAAPARVPFRAPIKTPKPRIVSAQTAIVTGPPGEEIWTDRYGRIKVQFHWDQKGKYDQYSSCWIRVNQGWAGKGWGHIAIPRIGQEVIVSFLEGDPDRPLVTGAVYNGQQFVPYPLPDGQTKSTWKSNSSQDGSALVNYNEIRFEDKAGSEEIYIQAERDLNQVVKKDLSQEVKNDKSVSIGRHLMEQVKGAVTSLVVGQLTKTVVGNITKLFKANVQKTVLGSELNVTALNLNQEVGGDYVLKVKGDVTIEASGKVTIKGSEIHLNP